MANNDILQYLRKTPHNTNVNVVKGMIGNESGGGAIEMETVFDEDITLTYTESDYSPATGKYNHIISNDFTNDGILRFTYEDIVFFATPNYNSFNSTKDNTDSTLPFTGVWCRNSYEIQGNFDFGIQTEIGRESEFQAYCQTPHHLKIEWFTI